MLRTLAVVALVVAPGLGGPVGVASGQDGGAGDPLANFRRYLAGAPYHERVFEQLLGRLAASGGIADLVAIYAAEHAADRQDEATAVVLSRLLAETGEYERALELLGGIEDERAAALRARLWLAHGDHAAAIAELSSVADNATDSELVRAALEQRATAQLASGDRGGARESFVRLGTLDSSDASWRIEVGERLAAAGFSEAAAAELRAAAELARGDPARRSTALAALGTELVYLGREGEAVEAWFGALPPLAHDHWLARDLRARLVALHERGGRLDELVERYRGAVAAEPANIAARIALVDALERAARDDEALDAASGAVAVFAADPALAATRRELARRLGARDVLVEECQRWIARDGSDADARELRFELGELFASEGRYELAAEQWGALLDLRAGDAATTARIAGRWIAHGRADAARGLFEHSVELEPDDVERYADLVNCLVQAGERDAADEWIERAEVSQARSPSGLTRVAELFVAARRREDAARCLAAAAALDPTSSERRSRLGEAELGLGRREAAQASFRTAAELASSSDLRRAALERYAQSSASPANPAALGAAMGRERARLETATGSEARTARLALLALHVRYGEATRVERAFQELFADYPEDLWAREWRAEWLAEDERFAEAIEAYDDLARRDARGAIAYLFAQLDLVAQLDPRLERERIQASTALLERIAAIANDDEDALARVATELGELGQARRAAEHWERVLRLSPGDPSARLALARAYRDAGLPDQARREARLAYGSADREVRRAALAVLSPLLDDGGALEAELGALDGRVAANSFDLESGLLAVDLLRRAERPGEALERLDSLLVARPFEARLLDRRARVLLELERLDEARVTIERLRSRGGQRDGSDDLDLIEALLDAPGPDAPGPDAATLEVALELALDTSDPLAVRPLLHDRGLERAELGLLERLAERPDAGPDVLGELARLYERADCPRDAIAVLERMRASEGADWRLDLHIGALHAASGDREAALEIGRQALAVADDLLYVEGYYDRLKARRAFRTDVMAVLLDACNDEVRIRAYLGRLSARVAAPEAVAFVAQLRTRVVREGRHPDRHTLVSWARWLHGVEIAMYADPPRLVAGRLDRLRSWAERRELREKEAADLGWMISFLPEAPTPADRQLLRRSFELFPRSPIVLTALGACYDRHGSVRDRVQTYEHLREALAEPKNMRERELAVERARAAHDAELAPTLDATGASRAEIDRALDLCFDPDRREEWEPAVVLSVEQARLLHALALTDSQRVEEARAALEADRSCPPYVLRVLAETLADPAPALRPYGEKALAELAQQALRSRGECGPAAPIVEERLRGELDRALWMWIAKREAGRAYEVLLRNGYRERASELLATPGVYVPVALHLRGRFVAAKRAVAAAGLSPVQREERLRALQDATMYLAIVYRGGPKSRRLQEPGLWEDLREVNPNDQAALWRQAGLATQRADWERAAQAFEALVLVLREWDERPQELRDVWREQRVPRGGVKLEMDGRSPLWQRAFELARVLGPLDPLAPWLASIHARLAVGDTERAAQSLEELLDGGYAGAFPDPAALDALLRAEDFGPGEDRARAAILRWRAR